MSNLKYGCIDAGTENCPCYLAETGNCIYCSRLAGKDYCDCDWRGVCVFNEFRQNGEKTRAAREEFEAKITEKKQYMEDLYVLVLDTGAGFAIKASRPGSFISVKKPGYSDWYSMPLSVIKSDIENGYIHIAIKAISAKSKTVLGEAEQLSVRGVFRNGIIGLEEVTKVKGPVAVISKGIGFAAAAHFINSYPDCSIYIDTDKICQELVRDYMSQSVRGRINYVNLNEGRNDIVKELEGYDGAVIAASEYFTEYFKEACDENMRIAVLNNCNICCGEGICGACCDSSGNKMCKCCSR